MRLVCHPDTPSRNVSGVSAEMVMAEGGDVLLVYRVGGTDELTVSAQTAPKRRDGLWQTTCFEMFLKARGAADYIEYNLSPSLEWAAYRFSDYRAGMAPLPCAAGPHIEAGFGEGGYVLEARIDLSDIAAAALEVGLSAVIEERDGTKSYWALVHPPGKPDFHHPACFAFHLPPPSRT